MTDSGPAGGTPRSGGGCGTAFGLVLILAGGFFLWANLSDTPLALVLLDALPLAAVWWPLLLVVWGAWKLITRLRTGRARLGFGEVFLLLLFILGGTVFTLAQRAIESQGLHLRLVEVRRLVEQQSGRFHQHVFITEQDVPLPPEAEVDILISLPTGNVRVAAAPAVDPPAGADSGPEATAPGLDPPAGADSGPEDATAAVRSEAGPEGRVQLVKRVWAADEAEAAARADAVRLRAGPFDAANRQFPVRVEDSGVSEVALELLATLPAGVGVTVLTEEGSVRIDGPFVRVEARTGEGPVEIRGAGGPVSVTASDGAVWASAIEGALEVQARRAAVEVDSVTGPATVESEGAPVWISGAASSVTVHARNAPVEVAQSFGPIEVETRISSITVDRIGGSAVLRSDFGDVTATSVDGPLRIRTESALVEVRGAHSGVDVDAEGGSLVFDDILGPLTVASGRGEVRASRLLGPASFTGAAGAVTVREFGDTLSVTGGDAEVDVGTGTLGGDVALSTDRGDIRLTLPAAGSFTLSAETDGGEVESDFALEQTDSAGSSRWDGLAGSGAERITVSTNQGDVRVRAHPEPGERP